MRKRQATRVDSDAWAHVRHGRAREKPAVPRAWGPRVEKEDALACGARTRKSRPLARVEEATVEMEGGRASDGRERERFAGNENPTPIGRTGTKQARNRTAEKKRVTWPAKRELNL